MGEVMVWLKGDLAARGKQQRDLVVALQMPYARINRMINGLAPAPWDIESRVRRVLAEWDAAIEKHAQGIDHV